MFIYNKGRNDTQFLLEKYQAQRCIFAIVRRESCSIVGRSFRMGTPDFRL